MRKRKEFCRILHVGKAVAIITLRDLTRCNDDL
ncbi:hypothetical protein SDC9_127071 [bioreactor metagenome]|uniref:Uncharacterized protein n=1 Tax=bioreactor metagenome TaxID=1076179 RepID=A0A645CSX2_9ZZZZ